MDLAVTGALTALSVGLAVLCGWLGARPLNVLKGPRLIPYRILMMLLAVAAIVLSTHAASLLGLIGR